MSDAAISSPQSSEVRQRAPAPHRLPGFPASWYLFCPSIEVDRLPVSQTIGGHRLVAFRSTDGRVTVLDARCSHLGADLGKGTIVGDRVRCAFHGWEYGADGACARIPAMGRIPEFARQTAYPVQERSGMIYFFNGRDALFPLPFFHSAGPDQLAMARSFDFTPDLPWYLVGANGFDSQHLQTVHDRRLVDGPHVDCPARYARRSRYTVQVTGNSLCDRIIRRLAGDTAEVSITVWGGSLNFVEARFARAHSYIMVALKPLDRNRTLVQAIPFVHRPASRTGRAFLEPVSKKIRHLFTRAFFVRDFEKLKGIQYNPARLIESDGPMIEYFRWVGGLPHEGTPPARSGDAGPYLETTRRDTC